MFSVGGQQDEINKISETPLEFMSKCSSKSCLISSHQRRQKEEGQTTRCRLWLDLQQDLVKQFYFHQEGIGQLFLILCGSRFNLTYRWLSLDLGDKFSMCYKCALTPHAVLGQTHSNRPLNVFETNFCQMCSEHVKIIACGLKQVNKKSWILNLIQNLYWGETYC